jgi:hypothetical protein
VRVSFVLAGLALSCGSEPSRDGDDAPPPALETTFVRAPDAVAESPVTFELAASDEIATFECSRDGDAFEACAPVVETELALGPHRFEARAVDASGRRDDTPASAQLTVVQRADHPNVAVLTAGDAYGPEGDGGYFAFDGDLFTAEFAAFYALYPDDYGALVVFTEFPVLMLPFERTLRFDVEGIGLEDRYGAAILGTDRSGEAGSAGALESLVFMTDIGFWDRIAEEDGEDEILSVLDQEFAHRWAAYVLLPGEAYPDILRDATRSHWNFTVSLDAPSPMSIPDGFVLDDHGDGTFTTHRSPDGASYASIDLYLMGLLPPEEVPDFWFVRNPDPMSLSIDAFDADGMTFTGERVEVAFADILGGLGPRVPTAADAPHAFPTAFVAVALPGNEPDPAFLEFVDQTRRDWEDQFSTATRGTGTVETALFPTTIGM